MFNVNNETIAVLSVAAICIASIFVMSPEQSGTVVSGGIGGLVGYLKGFTDASKTNQNQ